MCGTEAPTEPLTAILAEIADLDERIARNRQREQCLRENTKSLQERRDELCRRGSKAMGKQTTGYIVTPTGVWRRTDSGTFEKIKTIDAETVPVPIPGATPMPEPPTGVPEAMAAMHEAADNWVASVTEPPTPSDLLDRIKLTGERATVGGYGVLTILALLESGMRRESVLHTHHGLTSKDIDACVAWGRMHPETAGATT